MNEKVSVERPQKPVIKSIGTFLCGLRHVDLVFDDSRNGGYFSIAPKSGRAQIVVGKGKDWDQTLAILLHETAELICVDLGLRFSPSIDIAEDHAAYLFVMRHHQFSELWARAGEFLGSAIPALKAEAWPDETKVKIKRKRPTRK